MVPHLEYADRALTHDAPSQWGFRNWDSCCTLDVERMLVLVKQGRRSIDGSLGGGVGIMRRRHNGSQIY